MKSILLVIVFLLCAKLAYAQLIETKFHLNKADIIKNCKKSVVKYTPVDHNGLPMVNSAGDTVRYPVYLDPAGMVFYIEEQTVKGTVYFNRVLICRQMEGKTIFFNAQK